MLELDLIQTLAVSGVVLLLGYGLRGAIPLFARHNLPGPVLGGLVASLAVLALKRWDVAGVKFDASPRELLQNAFFTAIGFGASYGLLKRGGALVAGLLALTAVGAVLQNVLGVLTARALGQPALLGVLCGSVTLTGGPATGLAFAEEFEKAGVAGADAVAVACAMGGIIMAGILGAPLGTWLIERRLRSGARREEAGGSRSVELAESGLAPTTAKASRSAHEAPSSFALIKNAAVMAIAMGVGGWFSAWLTAHGIRLPSYIGGMIAAAAMRNLDDARGWIGLSHEALSDLGNVALAFFLALAMMTLDLEKLAEFAMPLAVILALQVASTAAFCLWPVFPLMGGEYDAAVITSGFYGFMIGTTPVSVANMDSLVRRYGPSPRAFLAVPIVGAFFLDLVNVLLIQACLILFR